MPHPIHLSSTAAPVTPQLPAPPSKLHHLPPPPPLPASSDPTRRVISFLPDPKPPKAAAPVNTQLQENLLYLDSLGIDSFRCLTSHPLLVSASLFQFKSVIDFLYTLDISIREIRRAVHMCPEILTASVPSTLRPAVAFLVLEAGVEGRNLPGVIHGRPRLLTCSVEERLRPALFFLQSDVGIKDVSRWTALLSCSVESKFMPRLDYFQKLGFSEREAMEMFRKFPSLFCYSIEENMEPKFNYFMVETGRELKELIDFPQYFSYSLEKRIKPRHQTCKEKGLCWSLPFMLKSSEVQFQERLQVCCNSSMPVRSSPLWCAGI